MRRPQALGIRPRAEAMLSTPIWIVAICLGSGSAAWAQRVYFGVVGGTNLTNNFLGRDTSAPADVYGNPASRFQYLSGPRSLIFGGLVEIGLSDRLAVEANVLLRPMKNKLVYSEFFADGSSRTTTVRYTRWKRESIYPKYATKPDQIEFLTSIAYRTEPGLRRIAGHRLLVGALAGLPLTRGFLPESYDSGYGYAGTERFRYLAGLSLEIDLAPNVSIEADGLYRPLNARSDRLYGQAHFSVLTWQIPVLAKHRWHRPDWTPFAEAGPSFRLTGNLNGYNPSHYGITVGTGVETRAHGIRLAPTLRYTRWTPDEHSYLRTNPNSVELLFGVAF